MANVRGATVLILSLIQWSHSQIVSTVPESWYSANVIKDGNFSPKPISELFSTSVDTFSTINPIVVLPTSRSPPPSSISSSFQTSLDPFTGSTLPASIITRDPTTLQTFSTTALPPIPSSISTLSTAFPFTPTTAPTTFITPPPPSSPNVQTIQTVQTFAPTNPPAPNIQYILCPTCPQPTQSSPILPVSTTPSPLPIVTSSPFPTQSTFTRTASSIPCVTSSPIQNSTLRQGFPFIRIRMYTSRGAGPPVFVNATPRSTTVRTTTTRRPKRNRKNNYDACVNACGGGRNPICAAPLATRPVDPNALRGFPSICHMACYNSFKKNQYEKLADGRCGRLRTRIRPLDSRDKIRRDELNKNQYQVVSGDTVIDIAPLPNKK